MNVCIGLNEARGVPRPVENNKKNNKLRHSKSFFVEHKLDKIDELLKLLLSNLIIIVGQLISATNLLYHTLMIHDIIHSIDIVT